MKKLFLALVFMFVTVVATADIFIEGDSFKVGTGIETTKGMSGVISLEYGLTLDKVMLGNPDYEAPEYPLNGSERGIIVDDEGNSYLTNLEVGFGTQYRILHEQNSHQAFYVNTGYTFHLDHEYEYLPTAIKPTLRLGVASDLDNKGGGFYVGGGAEFFFTDEWFANVLFESEDGTYRNTFGVGYKVHTLPFLK